MVSTWFPPPHAQQHRSALKGLCQCCLWCCSGFQTCQAVPKIEEISINRYKSGGPLGSVDSVVRTFRTLIYGNYIPIFGEFGASLWWQKKAMASNQCQVSPISHGVPPFFGPFFHAKTRHQVHGWRSPQGSTPGDSDFDPRGEVPIYLP